MADAQATNALQDHSKATSVTDVEDPLAHLYRMSTTSAGGQEYVAINSAAIAAFLLGVASVLAFAANVFIVVPVAGLICAIIALVQIRRSSGTQTGKLLAAVGLVLAVGISAAKAGLVVNDYAQARADTRQVVPVIERLSQDIHTARYDEAYDDLFSSAFHQRIDRKAFAAAFQQFSNFAEIGPVKSIDWNGQSVDFGEIGSSGVRVGYMMTLMKFERAPLPSRPVIAFSTRDGAWRIDNIEMLFPNKKKGQNDPQ